MNLRENESVIWSARRHWITIIGPLVFSFVATAVIIGTVYYFNLTLFGYQTEAVSLLILIMLLVDFYRYYIWSKNRLFITNQRVINCEQNGIFDRTVIEVLFQDISDIKFSQSGPTADAFDYGDIVLRTSGETEIRLKMMPNPEKIMEIINQTKVQIKNVPVVQ